MIQRTQRELPNSEALARAEDVGSRGALKVSACQAYDYVLLAALRAQVRRSAYYAV
jgi:hypothetical protein